MWQVLIDHFHRFPAQERVVRLMIAHGLSVRMEDDQPKIFAGPVELADTAVARAAGVDRRIVRATAETVARDARLSQVFHALRPALDLRAVAPLLGCGVVEIIPDDPGRPGILAGVSKVIADAGLSVRQAIGEDPEFKDQALLWVVTGQRIPGDLVPALQDLDGVRGVALY